MDYNSLIASKGTAGSLASWVNYTKLDTATIVDEAQALIYSQLRVREMRSAAILSIPSGAAFAALPSNFLDPIGPLHLTAWSTEIYQVDNSEVIRRRAYFPTSGSLGNNPFSVVINSTVVTVNLPNHGFTQNSTINLSNATAFNGVAVNGDFAIVAVPDDNFFDIDITPLGVLPNSTGAGGGAAVAYTCNVLTRGLPTCWAIWGATAGFDQVFDQAPSALLNYYARPTSLSASSPTNFLTIRYPTLLRTACQAAAADFMKDDTEYQKCCQRLAALIQSVNAENDLSMRGMDISPINP